MSEPILVTPAQFQAEQRSRAVLGHRSASQREIEQLRGRLDIATLILSMFVMEKGGGVRFTREGLEKLRAMTPELDFTSDAETITVSLRLLNPPVEEVPAEGENGEP